MKEDSESNMKEYAAAEAPILNRTSAYTITFTHHFEGRLGSELGLV